LKKFLLKIFSNTKILKTKKKPNNDDKISSLDHGSNSNSFSLPCVKQNFIVMQVTLKLVFLRCHSHIKHFCTCFYYMSQIYDVFNHMPRKLLHHIGNCFVTRWKQLYHLPETVDGLKALKVTRMHKENSQIQQMKRNSSSNFQIKCPHNTTYMFTR
jgi:hypothetical protein